ncbi:N-acetylmuramoyl-L-alanine amidase [Acidaminobacterium chupaoyuni]|mgnify:CR=1 FL=1
MPKIYLSPSTQESNPYINGGTEEQYMNLLADELEPYLISNAIAFTRNSPDMTAASSIRQANAGNYNFYLALHSNAAGEANTGTVRGSIAFYCAKSRNGKRAADLIVKNLKTIYPLPELVRAVATTSLGEVTMTRMPAVLVEIAYHDNLEDAVWIQTNLPLIASNLAVSLTEYFGIPFIPATQPRWGTVELSWGSLNLRQKPSLSANILAHIPNHARVLVLGQWQNWYSIDYNGILGYASADYIS